MEGALDVESLVVDVVRSPFEATYERDWVGEFLYLVREREREGERGREMAINLAERMYGDIQHRFVAMASSLARGPIRPLLQLARRLFALLPPPLPS